MTIRLISLRVINILCIAVICSVYTMQAYTINEVCSTFHDNRRTDTQTQNLNLTARVPRVTDLRCKCILLTRSYYHIFSHPFYIYTIYNCSTDTVKPLFQSPEKSTTVKGSELRTPPGCGRSDVEVVNSGSRVSPRKRELSFKTPDGEQRKFQKYSSM